MAEFVAEVAEAFGKLIGEGLLSIEAEQYSPKEFGNAVVVLRGKTHRIRLVRDRGQTFADAASGSDPEEWFPLQLVVRAVEAGASLPDGLLTPVQAAAIVGEYFEALESGLGAKRVRQTKRRLAELEQEATERFLRRSER